jgi:hypothetical protein
MAKAVPVTTVAVELRVKFEFLFDPTQLAFNVACVIEEAVRVPCMKALEEVLAWIH